MTSFKNLEPPEWGRYAYWDANGNMVDTKEEAVTLERYVYHTSELAHGIDLVIEKLNKINERLDDII